jgi:transposase
VTKKEATRVRRYFTEVFKKDAVAMVSKKRTVTAVARELGIARSLLQRWKDQLEGRLPPPGSGTPAMTPEAEEIRRLRQELRQVTESRDILKKALVFFADEKK